MALSLSLSLALSISLSLSASASTPYLSACMSVCFYLQYLSLYLTVCGSLSLSLSHPAVSHEDHSVRRQPRARADGVRVDAAGLLPLICHLQPTVVYRLQGAQHNAWKCSSWTPAELQHKADSSTSYLSYCRVHIASYNTLHDTIVQTRLSRKLRCSRHRKL